MPRRGGAGANAGARKATGPKDAAKKVTKSALFSESAKVHSSDGDAADGHLDAQKVKEYTQQFQGHGTVSVEAARRKLLKLNQAWTANPNFMAVVSLAIIANAFSLGFEMDYGEEYRPVFVALDHIFTAVFFIEFLCRQHAEGPRKYFTDSANILDFLLVVLSVTETWILPITGMDSSMDTRSMSILRIVRLCRLVRLVRIFRVFKELTIMVEGMSKTKAIIFWGSVFLLVIVYMFAMAATMMFGNSYTCEGRRLEPPSDSEAYQDNQANKQEGFFVTVQEPEGGQTCEALYQFPEFTQEELFGSLANSMATLYMCLFEGCGFDVIRPMLFVNPLVMIYWYLFIFLTSFGILNVILGLFCETVITSALEADKNLRAAEEDKMQEKLQELQQIWQRMDKDGSGDINHEEFQKAIQSDLLVMDCIEAMGLAGEDDLFHTLDFNQTGSLSHHEFFQGMMLLMNGSRPMTAKDAVATHLTCQCNHNLLQSMLGLLQDSKILGELTVIKEGLRTTILLPGQKSPKQRKSMSIAGEPDPAEPDLNAESEIEEQQAGSVLVPIEEQQTSVCVVPVVASEAAKEACTSDVAFPSVIQGDCNNSSPIELDMVSDNFTLQDSFLALQTRVGQMEGKMESRLGGLENQLKVQQQEIVNISHKMDSIANALVHMLQQGKQQKQKAHSNGIPEETPSLH